jgi:metallo-beta-lactamase family protein
MSETLTVSFLGAAGTVTGSRYLLDYGGRRILVDCGLFQGPEALRAQNWGRLPVDPRSVEAVLLTHAHIDHSGFLPALVRAGFRGPIYCSDATLELCNILLPDSAYLQEEDARFANRHGFSRHKPALPLYTREDADRCLELFAAEDKDHTFEAAKGFEVTLRSAGHVLGACSAHVKVRGNSITFSGDVGRSDDPILTPPSAPLSSDYLVCESTYGDRVHPKVDREAELLVWLSAAVERRGVVVIPAFAVGRAQTLLLHIARLKQAGRLADVPVFLDSPMAIDASALYHRFRREHRLSDAECDLMCRAPSLVNTPEQSKALDQRAGPMIIISASGMATGGRVVHHLKAFMGDPNNLVLLAGFQAPGTRGGSLAQGAKTLRIHGQDHPVLAQVGQLESASSHADSDELVSWIRKLPRKPNRVFITHGEPQASSALQARIERELGWKAEVPEPGAVAEL